MVCLLWNYGISLFLFLEASLKFPIEQGNLLMVLTNIINLKRIDVMEDIDSVQSSRQEGFIVCVRRQ